MATAQPSRWQNLVTRVKQVPWLRLLWWLMFSSGIGLLQVWTVIFVIIAILSFWPMAYDFLGKPAWGVNQILGNSVLLFFATSVLGQAVYTLWSRNLLRGYHLAFSAFFMAATLIVAIVLYALTILFGEPPVREKYWWDIAVAGIAFAYATYVELFTRQGE